MVRTRCRKSLFILAALLLLAEAAFAGSGSAELEGVLNLNEATVEQLRLLPGIGPGKAGRIVEYRQKRRFRRTEDLVLVKGIGPATFKRLAPHLRISGPTTLKVRRSKARQ